MADHDVRRLWRQREYTFHISCICGWHGTAINQIECNKLFETHLMNSYSEDSNGRLR